LPAPDGLALAVAKELLWARDALQISNRGLGKMTKISEAYLRDRFDFTMTLTLADVERLCAAMKLGDPGKFIADVELGGHPAVDAVEVLLLGASGNPADLSDAMDNVIKLGVGGRRKDDDLAHVAEQAQHGELDQAAGTDETTPDDD
jgi:hypothetical protein